MKKLLLYCFLILNVVLIVILWWQGSSGSLWLTGDTTARIISLGRLCGLIAELVIALQLVLIGRITFVEQEFGHDGLNRLHRFNGQAVALFLLAHPLLIVWGYSRLNQNGFVGQFLDFFFNWEHVILAVISLTIFLSLIAISIAIVRKRLRYETWYFMHLLMYVAVTLVIWHQVKFGDFAGQQNWIAYWYILNFGALGLVIVYKWLKSFYYFFRFQFTLEKIVAENQETTSLYIEGRGLEKFKFLPGQFANLTFLQKGMWFTHPFSFSSVPNGKFLRLTVKASGDFTDKIRTLKPRTKIVLDGPLGIFTKKVAKRSKFLFLAGGIGITPIRALIEDLAKKGNNIVLLYSNKNEQEMIFKNELTDLQHRYHFIMTQMSEVPAGSGYELGRIDEEKIRRLVPDFLEREVYICGPTAMIDSLKKLMLKLGVSKPQIHYEKFAY